jgi:hypothetical protein
MFRSKTGSEGIMSSAGKSENGGNEKKGGKTGLIIGITVAVIVILALAGVIIYLVASKNKEPEQQVAGVNTEAPREELKEKRNVVVTSENVEDVLKEMSEAEYIEPGYFETSMTNEWHFADGKAISSDAYVANVANNTNDVYFDVVLADDEEKVVYASPVIPRGGVLDQIALDTQLEKGSYDCIMIYHLVDDDQNTISTLRVKVTLIIEG